ncbi:serine hydrolase domain-containing protein [Kitasatospora sp. NPDC048538]|uniref:serine hydrolase domain-containing protein n=1 Tax=unclassified Kitasatospora TaxID=2633591 RepID=UPI0033F8AAC9
MNALDTAVAAVVRAAEPHATAVTVAVARGERQEVRCHGRTGRGRAAACTPDTVFELGSVSKTFTALLLAEMAARGELALDDPLEHRLPPNWPPVPSRCAEPVRLLHLATHTSGLPRLPPGLLAAALPRWRSNPYAGFGDDDLRTALARTTPRRRPGEHYRYSNYGVGLLGRALAETGRSPYGALLAERICGPLGLRATGCAPDAPGRATGYLRGRELPPWHAPGLPGAAAVRASGADVLRYLRAHLDGLDGLDGMNGLDGLDAAAGTSLGAALREVRRPRLRLPRSGDEVCLVWNRRRSGGHDLYFHAGATRGFTVLVGFSPQTAAAVAALANTGPTLGSHVVQAGYEVLRVAARTA